MKGLSCYREAIINLKIQSNNIAGPSCIQIAFLEAQSTYLESVTPCLRHQIRYRLRRAGSCQWADSISALAHYQHYPHYTCCNITTIPALPALAGWNVHRYGMFPRRVCDSSRGWVWTCVTRDSGMCNLGDEFVYRILFYSTWAAWQQK